LENLKVQLSYCSIRAPISGRISQAAVRSALRASGRPRRDRHHQSARAIYVTFAVAQRLLPELRIAMTETGAPSM